MDTGAANGAMNSVQSKRLQVFNTWSEIQQMEEEIVEKLVSSATTAAAQRGVRELKVPLCLTWQSTCHVRSLLQRTRFESFPAITGFLQLSYLKKEEKSTEVSYGSPEGRRVKLTRVFWMSGETNMGRTWKLHSEPSCCVIMVDMFPMNLLHMSILSVRNKSAAGGVFVDCWECLWLQFFYVFCLNPERDNETDSLNWPSEGHQQGQGVWPLSSCIIIL